MVKILSKHIDVFLCVSILGVIGAVLFFSRQIFFYRYEPEYYENWYYHSQWNYPQSTRGISDGELYKFVGYRLVEGENPFNINYEVPPFGKYFYGLAERYIGNPYWVSILVYLSSVAVVFLLCKELFRNNQIALLSTLLFVTTPFVATQVKETMLDLPLMFLYLMQIWLFIKYISNRKLVLLLTAGIFLGLATGTKVGVYTPPALAVGLLLIFLVSKKILDLPFYICSVFLGYVLSWFCYFSKHPNPIPWLRLHEKPLKFYLGPENTVDHLNQWRGIFLNSYQGWWTNQRTALGDWSFVLPLGVLAMLLVLVWATKAHNKQWAYIAAITSVFLITNSFISFFPRYLMPAIPLFILLISCVARRFKYMILILSLLNLPFLFNSLNPRDASGDTQAVARFISTRAYRELYRSIASEQRKEILESDFINTYENFLEALKTREVNVSVTSIDKFGAQTSAKCKIKYVTNYGELTYEPTLHFVKINNQWKLLWKWDYLWPRYSPESKIVVNEKTIPISSLENMDGVVVARRGNGEAVYVIPRLMFDWNKYLDILSQLTNQGSMEVDRRIKMTVPDQYPRFVGYLDPASRKEKINEALSFPGVSLQDIGYLVIVKSSTSPEDVSGLINRVRAKYPELFYIQAEAYLEKGSGEKIPFLFKQPQQKDVIIQM